MNVAHSLTVWRSWVGFNDGSIGRIRSPDRLRLSSSSSRSCGSSSSRLLNGVADFVVALDRSIVRIFNALLCCFCCCLFCYFFCFFLRCLFFLLLFFVVVDVEICGHRVLHPDSNNGRRLFRNLEAIAFAVAATVVVVVVVVCFGSGYEEPPPYDCDTLITKKKKQKKKKKKEDLCGKPHHYFQDHTQQTCTPLEHQSTQ